MTVLYDPGRRTVYTDEACFPLQFADGEAHDPSADLHTLIAAMVALHGDWTIDDACPECQQPELGTVTSANSWVVFVRYDTHPAAANGTATSPEDLEHVG